MSKQKFNGRDVEVRQSGTKHYKNFNGEGEPGTRNKYSLYDSETGSKVGAVVPASNGVGKVMDNGKCVGTVKFDPE